MTSVEFHAKKNPTHSQGGGGFTEYTAYSIHICLKDKKHIV